MSVADDVRKIFSKLPSRFIPHKANGVNSTIQVNLNGDGGGSWLLQIANGQILIEEKKVNVADLTLSLDASDYVALSYGEVNPMSLFMGGKLKLQGDMSLALKFQEMFDRGHV